MNELTNEQFIEQITKWKDIVAQGNIMLPGGRPIPDKFYHVFLGIGYSTYRKLSNCDNPKGKVPLYTSRMVRFINKLEYSVFLDEIRLSLIDYVDIYLTPKH